MARLTAVSGVGRWTAEGFLTIALHRDDVVLAGDLALRKAIQRAYGLDHLPGQAEVLAIAEAWRPYRNLAVSFLFAPPVHWISDRQLVGPSTEVLDERMPRDDHPGAAVLLETAHRPYRRGHRERNSPLAANLAVPNAARRFDEAERINP